MNFASLQVKDRREIIRRVQAENGLNRQIIEKDWWVAAVLRAFYQSVIEHRRIFIGLRGFDYTTLQPGTLHIVPPEDVYESWKQDYEIMQETMIYGDSLPFDKLVEKIRSLNEKIDSLSV